MPKVSISYLLGCCGHAARSLFVAELHAGVERGVLRGVPVHPEHLVVPRPVLHGLEGVVVRVRSGGGRIREREEVEQRLRCRVDPPLWNDVTRETGWPAGLAGAVSRQQRVTDVDQATLLVEGLREIAATFELRGHPALVQPPGVGARENILRPEEEQLVPVAVELRARDEHRASERPGGVVERVRGGIALRGDPLRTLPPPVELVAIPGVVTLVVGGAAPEVLRAAPGNDRNGRAGAAAVFRLEVRRLDADLGNRIERRSRVVAAVGAGVLVGDPVVREVEAAAAAVDREAAHAAPPRRFARAGVDHPGQELEVAGEVPPLRGDVLDLLAIDETGPRRVGRLDERRFTGHGDRFLQLTDLQGDLPQRHAVGCAKYDAALLVGLEPFDGNGQVVGPGKQVGKQESAFGASYRVAGLVRADVPDSDRDARQHAATRVGNGAGDLTCEPLRGEPVLSASQQQHRHREGDSQRTVSHHVLLQNQQHNDWCRGTGGFPGGRAAEPTTRLSREVPKSTSGIEMCQTGGGREAGISH